MRILILLGETASSQSAREFACMLARRSGAVVTGLAGVDLTSIDQRMIGGIGSASFQIPLEAHLIEQAQQRCARLHEAYEAECRTLGVRFEWLSFEGDPLEAAQAAAETRDLIITGHDTAFGGDFRESLPDPISRLLLLSPRPVIVTGDDVPRGQDVLVAYDGSLSCMRSLQLYTLLGLHTGARVHVTSISPDQELAERRLHSAEEFLHSHSIAVERAPIVTAVHPAEVIRIEVADRRIGMIVMGCYGHHGWRETLLGSTTSDLVESPPCHLFLFH